MKRNILIGAACLIIIVFGSAFLYFLHTNPNLLETHLPQFFGTYVESYVNGKLPPGTTVIDATQLNKDSAFHEVATVLPKSKVSNAYYNVFNPLINEIALLDTANQDELTPLLTQARIDSQKSNYQDFITTIANIKSLNEVQKKRLAILTAYFNNLAVINGTIQDEQTKSLTVDFISAGKDMVTAFGAYSVLVDDIAAGTVSSQTTSGAKTTMSDLLSATNAFHIASQKLSLYFAQAVSSELKAATTTPVK